jgi:two-component system, chemotaxis family, protein-glutamate methylesterase/glutaminase
MSAPGHSTAAPFEMVVVVASLGGLQAMSTVLAGLPADFPVPVVLVQHSQRSDYPDRLAKILRGLTTLPVHTATPHIAALQPGATVVPGGYHALLEETRQLRLTEDPTLHGGDALMLTAGPVLAQRAIGVVLTGMLGDGARGVRAIKRHGGRVLVQDPDTARAAGMPSNAIATGCVDFVLPLNRIAPALITLAMAPGGADLLIVPSPPWARLSA